MLSYQNLYSKYQIKRMKVSDKIAWNKIETSFKHTSHTFNTLEYLLELLSLNHPFKFIPSLGGKGDKKSCSQLIGQIIKGGPRKKAFD